jgi:carboxylate-amine ligase
MCDMPPDLPSVLALTALTQCLVVDLAGGGDRSLDECGMMIARQNRWRAARYGLDAEFIDPRTALPSSARDTIRGLVERLAGVGEQLGCARQLECARAMAEGESGADRQLAVHRRTGDLLDVARWQTNGSTATSAPVPSAVGAAPFPVVGGPGVVGGWPRPLSAAGVFGRD